MRPIRPPTSAGSRRLGSCPSRRCNLPSATTKRKLQLDHRSIVLNGIEGALAHLGLARAYLLQGDKAKARIAYQDFLALWKDADPEIPILQQAKAEYQELQ
jgi:hypothetical protein